MAVNTLVPLEKRKSFLGLSECPCKSLQEALSGRDINLLDTVPGRGDRCHFDAASFFLAACVLGLAHCERFGKLMCSHGTVRECSSPYMTSSPSHVACPSPPLWCGGGVSGLEGFRVQAFEFY